ncbi:MAG: alginate export family protein [Syntrophobacterales bacterium]|nr:alginate export family protein [Syntrophobacterales bacterium]
MNKKYFYTSWLFLCILFLCAGDVLAEIKGDYGGSVRFRQEYIKNGSNLGLPGNSERNYFRMRSTLWGKVDFTSDMGIYARLANESRYYMGNYKPFELPSNPAESDSTRFDSDELIIDNLYFEAKNIFNLLDLRIGRQDFRGMYGEGFLIYEGTPGDGSRTAYFDALKATLRFTENHSLDLIYINNRQKDDRLPSLHNARSNDLYGYVNNRRVLNITDDEAVIVYGKSRITPHITVEPYYIYKREDNVSSYYNRHNGLGPSSDLALNTLGARIAYKTDMWHIRAEWAGQFGEYDDDRTRQGNGGYIFASQKFANVPWKPEWEIGYVRLSGDDPNTGKHEGWNPLFSRAPLLNEVFAYLYLNEAKPDSGPIPFYWTNLQIFKLGLTVWPTTATKANLFYQYLRSVEETNVTGSAVLSNSSKDRGHLIHLAVDYFFSEKFDVGIMTEYFIPGDFYNSNAKNSLYFQWQFQFKF